MKPLEDAEKKSTGAVEMNEENDYEDSESFLADMENMEGVVEDNEESHDENEYDAAEARYGGHDYPSDTESMKRMIANANATIDYSEDSDSSDDEEMTVKDYQRMLKSIW